MQKIVVIGGSAGSINVLKAILKGLPPDFPAAVLIAFHVGARESILPDLLQHYTTLPVHHALQGEPIIGGQILVAPPDVHLTVALDGRAFVHLSRGPKENHARPAIDPLFRSAAAVFGADAIGVVLSGFLDDGTVGLQAIKARGGIAIVQDPADAEVPDMPASALRYAAVDQVRRAEEIAPALVALVNRAPLPGGTGAPAGTELQDWIAIENRMFNQGADMQDLDRIGSRVAMTCPECGGAIWELKDSGPLRYRCHTGHAFTAKVLAGLQGGTVEEALWAAVRALHEQEQLFRQLHERAPLPDDEYLMKAEQAGNHAQLLRDLISTRMNMTTT